MALPTHTVRPQLDPHHENFRSNLEPIDLREVLRPNVPSVTYDLHSLACTGVSCHGDDVACILACSTWMHSRIASSLSVCLSGLIRVVIDG